MTIEEAIESLGDILRFVKPGDPPEEHKAIKLGIEALKRVQKMRTYKPTPPGLPLPGETAD